MPILTSTATFTVGDASSLIEELSTLVLPAPGVVTGMGRLVHPTLGTFDYEYKPDEWLNVDDDVIVSPVWSSTKTLGGAASALWKGNLKDVICEERWTQQGASMPVSMFRALLAIFANPVDPAVGYVKWFPNYTTQQGFYVLPADLVVGSSGSSQLAKLSGIGYAVMAFSDLIHMKDENGDVSGWMEQPVSLFLKIVGRV